MDMPAMDCWAAAGFSAGFSAEQPKTTEERRSAAAIRGDLGLITSCRRLALGD